MGQVLDRSASPSLITGTHLALLKALDPGSRFVAAHAQYYRMRELKRMFAKKSQEIKQLNRKHSAEWLAERELDEKELAKYEAKRSQASDSTIDDICHAASSGFGAEEKANSMPVVTIPTMYSTESQVSHRENDNSHRVTPAEDSTDTTNNAKDIVSAISDVPMQLSSRDSNCVENAAQEAITLDHISMAIMRLKHGEMLGQAGRYSVNQREFFDLFATHSMAESMCDRIDSIWRIWCSASGEGATESNEIYLDAMELLAGLIWLVPDAIGPDRLKVAISLFDPRYRGNIFPGTQHSSNKTQTHVIMPSLSQSEVAVMLLTTLSGLCIWTDGFFVPPQAIQVHQIAEAMFREQSLVGIQPEGKVGSGNIPPRKYSGMVRRLRVHELQKCAAALEQVSLERLLCSENIAADMDDNERSRSTRLSWMESFYYSSYNRKRIKLISDEMRDEEEAGGLRRVYVDIERPTNQDKLDWKRRIIEEHPPGNFRQMMANIELRSIRTSDFDRRNDNGDGSEISKFDLLTTRRVELLTMYLTVNWAHLLELSLPFCNLDADRISLLSEGIAINDSIRIADFSSNNIEGAGAAALARALRMNSSILKLDISRNRIGDEGASEIAGVLGPYYLNAKSTERKAEMAARKNMQRRERRIKSSSIRKAADGKGNGFKVGEGDEVDDEQCMEYETKIQKQGRNTTVQCLQMHSNNIGSKGAIKFAEVMRTHPALTSLGLRNNRIGDVAIEAIASGIRKSRFFVSFSSLSGDRRIGAEVPSCSLTSLDLRNNDVHDEGAVALASALTVTSRARSVRPDFKSFFRQDDASVVLHSSTKSAVQLVWLDLYGNSVRARGADALAQALSASPYLTYLNLSSNKVGFRFSGSKYEARKDYAKLQFNYSDLGAKSIAEALDMNCTLTHLDLSFNHLCTESGKALLESLLWSETIEVLNLSGNEISSVVVAEEEERGDPRLDISSQTRMRSRAAVSLSVPVTHSKEVNGQTVGTNPLSASGERRSYHAGGEAYSQTRYHYEHSRWPENTRPRQRKAVRDKMLPIEDEYDYDKAWKNYRQSLAKKQ